ncbi:MAG: hypothetical protein P8Z00_13765 [Anaerolineales bacterium]
MKAEQSDKAARGIWVEGLAVVLGLLGLVLILVPDKLHDAVFARIEWIKLMLTRFWVAFNHFLDQMTLAQMAGFLLLLAFLVILVWRQRWRLMNSPRLSAKICPDCGGELHRVHRHSFDRLLGNLSGIPLRRYKCGNEYCGWEGLRRRRKHQIRAESE